MPLALGLAPKVVDPRTLRYRAVSAIPWPSLPLAYSWDKEHPYAVPCPMFGNDVHGDCVEAAKGHQVLRFEFQENGAAPPITTAEVEAEYFRQSGGQDNGLVMLYSMRDWRKLGRQFGGKRYQIHSFLEVMPQNHDELKEAMIVGLGLHFGIRLPLSAADQINAHQPWDVVGGDRSVPGSWGGHAVHGSTYDAEGVTVETWGKYQKMTWRFIDAYCDECYLVVDDIDAAPASINTDALTAALGGI